MRIALLDVSHWHFPLYAGALGAAPVEVVAVSDPDPAVRERVAREFGCVSYGSAAAAIAEARFDLAFVFSRHAQMAAVADALIARGTPFVIEKPGGLSASEVAAVRARAEARRLFVAVPFVQLIGPVYAAISRLVRDEKACFSHSSWRFNGGPPSRYEAVGCAWMLDPALSGGGCLMNLGPHFIDLARRLHGPAYATHARLSHAVHGGAVEDYALVSMRHAGGATSLVETGYCFPDHPAKREYSFTLVGAEHYVRSCGDGIDIYRAGSSEVEHVAMSLDSDPLYAAFVGRCLADMRAGSPPVAGLADLEAVMRVIDTAYGES